MPDNLLQIGGASGAGAIWGGILTFFGFKKRIETLVNKVVYKDVCSATVEGIANSLNIQTELMKEMRTDIKNLSKK